MDVPAKALSMDDLLKTMLAAMRRLYGDSTDLIVREIATPIHGRQRLHESLTELGQTVAAHLRVRAAQDRVAADELEKLCAMFETEAK